MTDDAEAQCPMCGARFDPAAHPSDEGVVVFEPDGPGSRQIPCCLSCVPKARLWRQKHGDFRPDDRITPEFLEWTKQLIDREKEKTGKWRQEADLLRCRLNDICVVLRWKRSHEYKISTMRKMMLAWDEQMYWDAGFLSSHD